jgi:hypothetical protein
LRGVQRASTHQNRACDHEIAGDVCRENIARHEKPGEIDHARNDAEHRRQPFLHPEQRGFFVRCND